jgi:antitoxin PrlF
MHFGLCFNHRYSETSRRVAILSGNTRSAMALRMTDPNTRERQRNSGLAFPLSQDRSECARLASGRTRSLYFCENVKRSGTPMEAKLSSKCQATIPKVVRERLQIKPGDRFKFFFHPDGVIILPRIPTQCLKGSVPRLARPVSLKQMDKANKAEAAARFQRA